MTFAQRRNRLRTHFSERNVVVKWRTCVPGSRQNATCRNTWTANNAAFRTPNLPTVRFLRSFVFLNGNIFKRKTRSESLIQLER